MEAPKGIKLTWLIEAYTLFEEKESFFLKGFTRIAGTELLQQQIENGLSEYQIKKSWSKDLNEFKKIRKKYLIYP